MWVWRTMREASSEKLRTRTARRGKAAVNLSRTYTHMHMVRRTAVHKVCRLARAGKSSS